MWDFLRAIMRLSTLLMLLVCMPSNGLIVQLADLHTMAKKSDIVIHGFVGEQRVERDKLGRLITLTDVEIIEGLHGMPSGIMTIYQVGGEKNGEVMPLLGGHHYKISSEIFFFGLKMDQQFVSYGAGQGKLDVVPDGDQGVVVEDLGDVSVIDNGMSSHPSPLIFPDAVVFKEEVKLMLKHR